MITSRYKNGKKKSCFWAECIGVTNYCISVPPPPPKGGNSSKILCSSFWINEEWLEFLYSRFPFRGRRGWLRFSLYPFLKPRQEILFAPWSYGYLFSIFQHYISATALDIFSDEGKIDDVFIMNTGEVCIGQQFFVFANCLLTRMGLWSPVRKKVV